MWTDPGGYYFLNIMVARPGAQGRGIGRLLMESVTGRADAEGAPCYLESSRDVPNMQIYGRFGFEFATELECRDDDDDDDDDGGGGGGGGGGAIKLYAMVREPRCKGDGPDN